MYRLIKAIRSSHSMGVMHRDIKMDNIVINTDTHRLELIDWGLAELFFKESGNSLSVMTRSYQPPEILLDYKCYDYGIDMWGAGLVLSQMLFKKKIFDGKQKMDILLQMIPFYGYNVLEKYVGKYHLKIGILSQIDSNMKKSKRFEDFIDENNQDRITHEGIDLMKKLLKFDHSKRIGPEQALNHPYFDNIRHRHVDQIFGS